MKQKALPNITYITPKGLAKLENELAHLVNVRRQEIIQYLQDTMGNVEDPEFLFAQEEQAFVEGRIQELEQLLANVQVIEAGVESDLVNIGSTVVIREGELDPETYTIVGSAEADPSKGLISNMSPLGKALLNCKVGDEVEVRTPNGLVRCRVLAVQ